MHDVEQHDDRRRRRAILLLGTAGILCLLLASLALARAAGVPALQAISIPAWVPGQGLAGTSASAAPPTTPGTAASKPAVATVPIAVAGTGTGRGTSASASPSAPGPANAGGGAGTPSPSGRTVGTVKRGEGVPGRQEVAGLQAQGAGGLELDGGQGRPAGLVLSNAKPGDARSTSLRIHNRSDEPMALSVRVVSVSDVPGPFGGLLSERLVVGLADGSRDVLRGRPRALGAVRELGTLPRRSTRSLQLSLAFPDGGTPPSPTTGDNLLQGSSVRMALQLTGRT